ncbi:MAG: hypothetical protein U1F43_10260 [Myxococcota bacterium]
MTWLRAAVTVLGIAAPGLAQAADPPPSEDEIFGAPTPDAPKPDEAKPTETPAETKPEETKPVPPDEAFPEPGQHPIVIQEDPLTLGGQLYLRLATTINDRGSAGRQRLSMPNLVDLYLDARPEERVRGFVSGRLSFDPTVAAGDTNVLGQSVESTRILLDQLWLKTDIARRVFVTIGQERIKWGSNRLWNPTDFLNAQKRDPLALFDERTGVPMLKLHVPIETWNVYGIVLLGGADHLDEIGAAGRLEMVAFGSTEIALSAMGGKGRKTSFGLDLSTALGDFDVTAEVSLTDEHGTLVYSGGSLDPLTLPTTRDRDAWVGRASAGIQYGFKVNSEDEAQYIGLEYFYNPLGYDDPSIYPFLIAAGAYQPFYVGKHYLGFSWVVPTPGDWDDETFTFSAIGNLSDKTYVTRLDFTANLHTRLTLQAYAMAQFGHRGGELHFAMDVPAGILDPEAPAFSVAAPVLGLGLNLLIGL